MISRFLHNSRSIRTLKPALTSILPFHLKFSSDVESNLLDSEDEVDITRSVFLDENDEGDDKYSKKKNKYLTPLGKYRYTKSHLRPEKEEDEPVSGSKSDEKKISHSSTDTLAMDVNASYYPGIPRLKNTSAVKVPNDGIASRIGFDEKKEVELSEEFKKQIPPSSFEKAKKYQSFLNFVRNRRKEFKQATNPAYMNVVTVGENTFNGEKIPPNCRIGEIDTFALSYNRIFEIPVKRAALVIDHGDFQCNDSVDGWLNPKNMNKYVNLIEPNNNFICGEYEDEFLLGKGRRLMLRKCIQKLLRKIENYENGELTDLPEFLIINGGRGSGKSFCLNAINEYCLKKNWIVLFNKSIYDVCNNGSNVIPNRRVDNTFDTFTYSVEILDNFIKRHAKKLRRCKVRGEYKDGYWRSGTEFSSKLKNGNATLYDMVKHGIDKYRDSGDILYHLRDELSEVKEFPVLISCDEYNLIYDKTVFEFGKLPVYGFQLRYNQAFQQFDIEGNLLHKPLKNGLCVYATTQKYPLRSNMKFDYSKYEINIPYYNKEELGNVLSYYVKNKGLQTNISVGEFERMFMITQGSGKIVRECCFRESPSYLIHYS